MPELTSQWTAHPESDSCSCHWPLYYSLALSAVLNSLALFDIRLPLTLVLTHPASFWPPSSDLHFFELFLSHHWNVIFSLFLCLAFRNVVTVRQTGKSLSGLYINSWEFCVSKHHNKKKNQTHLNVQELFWSLACFFSYDQLQLRHRGTPLLHVYNLYSGSFHSPLAMWVRYAGRQEDSYIWPFSAALQQQRTKFLVTWYVQYGI